MFLFLPICLSGYLVLLSKSQQIFAIVWLVLCSFFFYGWWNPTYLILIVFSMIFNFSVGNILSRQNRNFSKGLILWFGIAINLSLLAYFKYANFFVDQLNLIAELSFNVERIILPLAISFFTFQQIAFLVDSSRGMVREVHFLHYSLFVTFFPQLIAGPIVHHKDMLPQFFNSEESKLFTKNLVIGLSIFSIGFLKKTVIADGIAPYADIVFDTTEMGGNPSMLVAWGGALAYTMQLYFDFSGYSDMAIGIARMFGIVLPLNFYSPYKAINISEFWRRWHITLSHFLRDYVYIALGGNKKGAFSRYKNLFLTMFLGGIWHGAGWNFVLWGALHGFYLIIHQLWSGFTSSWSIPIPSSIKKCTAWAITFGAVVVGWVFFRAVSFESAITILQGMFGMNGVSIPNAVMVRIGALGDLLRTFGITTYLGGGSNFIFNWAWIAFLTPLAIMLPSTQDIFCKYNGSLSRYSFENKAAFWPGYKFFRRFEWRQNIFWALLISLFFVLGALTLSQVSEFLYFQF